MFKTIFSIISMTILPSIILAGDIAKTSARIKVQEKIIETMFETEPTARLRAEVEGLYLSGFGVVFTVEIEPDHSLSTYTIDLDGWVGFSPLPPAEPAIDYERALEKAEQQLQKNLEKLEKERKKAEDARAAAAHYKAAVKEYQEALRATLEKGKDERLDKLKMRLEQIPESFKDYLADYAPVLELPNKEALFIKVRIENLRLDEDLPLGYEIVVSGNELKSVKSGRTNREAFIKKISIEPKTETDDEPLDIQIMGKILRTVFEERKRGKYVIEYLDQSKSWASYVPGFGAVFLHKCRSGSDPFYIAAPDKIVGRTTGIIIDSGEDESSEKARESIARVRDEIMDVMVTYGPTLKSVKPEENVVVAVKFRRAFDREQHSALIMSAKKRLLITNGNADEIKKKIKIHRL